MHNIGTTKNDALWDGCITRNERWPAMEAKTRPKNLTNPVHCQHDTMHYELVYCMM